jgi:hypothetical protein
VGELERARAEAAQAKEEVLALAKKIIAILEQDIQVYVLGKVKEAFLGSFDCVQSMSREEVAALKRDAQAAAERAKVEIGEALTGTDEWLVKEMVAGYRSSILQNKRILEIVKRAGGYVREVLARHGFPEESIASCDLGPYSLSEFRSGQLIEELSKEYWKKMGAYCKLQQEIARLEAETKREAARKMWDAEP